MSVTYKEQLLTEALKARINEVVEYEVNNYNFKLAIEIIGDDPELQEFKDHLKGLLKGSLIEQRKAQIMLEVVQSQME